MGRYDYDDMPAKNNSRGTKGNRRTALATVFFILVALIVLVIYLIVNPQESVEVRAENRKTTAAPAATTAEEAETADKPRLIPLAPQEEIILEVTEKTEIAGNAETPAPQETREENTPVEETALSLEAETNLHNAEESVFEEEAVFHDSPVEETSVVEEEIIQSPITEEATETKDEAPVVEEEIIVEEVTSEEDTKTEERNPVVEEEIVVEEITPEEETISTEEKSVEDDAPVIEEEIIIEEIIPTSTEEETVTEDEVPVIEEIIPGEETMTEEETPVVEEEIIVEEIPAVEETTSSEEVRETEYEIPVVEEVSQNEEPLSAETAEETEKAPEEAPAFVTEDSILRAVDSASVVSGGGEAHFEDGVLVIKGKNGSAVKAVSAGTVTKTGRDNGLKYVVVTDDDGVAIRYTGFERVLVKLESRVKSSAVLGSIGSSTSSTIKLSVENDV